MGGEVGGSFKNYETPGFKYHVLSTKHQEVEAGGWARERRYQNPVTAADVRELITPDALKRWYLGTGIKTQYQQWV